MNYIVFDLELNQDYTTLDRKLVQKRQPPFEIIQLGAVKLDSEFNTVDNFNKYVKPIIYERLNPFVEELTGITQETLSNAEMFPEVYKQFIDFIGDKDSVFCVWGTSDISELYRNADIHSLTKTALPRKYINIQPYVSLHFHFPVKNLLRLEHAVQALNIPVKNTFHDAYNDAFYTAEILKKIYNSFILPKTFDPAVPVIRPPSRQRRVIDTEALINQFAKMYNRELTQEEKSMILLAYKMGKTGQFMK